MTKGWQKVTVAAKICQVMSQTTAITGFVELHFCEADCLKCLLTVFIILNWSTEKWVLRLHRQSSLILQAV